VFVDDALLDRSINAALLRTGLAYAELYSTMPFPLIGHMQDLVTQARAAEDLVTQARAAGAGFWPRENLGIDNPAQPTSVGDLADLVIFPSCTAAWSATSPTSTPTSPHSTPGSAPNPTATTPPNSPPANATTSTTSLYQVDQNGISLRHLPEQLIFLE
jgi:hypothetical protein